MPLCKISCDFGGVVWPPILAWGAWSAAQLLSPTVFTYEDLQKPIVYEQWAFVCVAFTGRLGAVSGFECAGRGVTMR